MPKEGASPDPDLFSFRQWQVAKECPQVSKLLGGFVSGLGGTVTEQVCVEHRQCHPMLVPMGCLFDRLALGDNGHMQWLVFRNSGLVTAEQYALRAADAGAQGKALGEGEFWDRFDNQRPLQRRRIFVLKCLREVVQPRALHANAICPVCILPCCSSVTSRRW